MDFQSINIQRKIILIAGAVGIISIFLPWVSVSMMGMSNSASGFRGSGIVVFLAFAAAIIIALIGNQSQKLDKRMWLAALAAAVIALLFVIISFGSSSNEMGDGFGIVDAGHGIGIYLALIASLGVLVGAWLYRNPEYDLKSAFNDFKSSTFTSTSASGNNRVSELERLIELKEKGKISEEEFQQLKSKII